MTASLRQRIEAATADPAIDARAAVDEVFARLRSGALRVAEKPAGASLENQSLDNEWLVNEWVKHAILLAFRYFPAQLFDDGVTRFFDRIASRHRDFDEAAFRAAGIRVSPGAVVRDGAYIAPGAVLMPCFVNVGAYIGENTMVDTWATVGSCAQIGRNVHLSGGVGIGGVLEPAQARPTIIEDNCFIGARSEVVEGVLVEHSAVLGMGVFIGQSTPIYDREQDTISYGRVPAGAVVVSGVLDRGRYGLNAAIIVKRVDARTRSKTAINELLRVTD